MHIFIAHARNGHIFTSSLKYDVTIAFLDPDFLYAAWTSTHKELVPTFGGYYLCAKFGEIDQEMRLQECTHTDRQVAVWCSW